MRNDGAYPNHRFQLPNAKGRTKVTACDNLITILCQQVRKNEKTSPWEVKTKVKNTD